MHTSDGPTSEENGAPHPLHDGAEPEPGSDDRNGSHPAPAASGQATAAERFAARHYDDVFHYCLRHVGSKEDAQDLTQEVFLRIVRANADGNAPPPCGGGAQFFPGKPWGNFTEISLS